MVRVRGQQDGLGVVTGCVEAQRLAVMGTVHEADVQRIAGVRVGQGWRCRRGGHEFFLYRHRRVRQAGEQVWA